MKINFPRKNTQWLIGIIISIIAIIIPIIHEKNSPPKNSNPLISTNNLKNQGIEFIGIGNSNSEIKSNEEDKRRAKAAALIDLKNKVASFFKGEKITSSTRVNDGELIEDRIHVEVNAFLKGIDWNSVSYEYNLANRQAKAKIKLPLPSGN